MKKIFYILIPLMLIGYILIITLLPRTKSETVKASEKNPAIQNLITKNQDMPSDHVNQALNCKSCHSCEYPTKNDPCIWNCPRNEMLTISHSPEEGPQVVNINQMSENYTGVLFSHKIHSQMSEMSDGCSSCHHYNTTGPILNCRECHVSNRAREDVSLPDLKAAYHRQCLTCHKQWSNGNGCNTQCHLRKDANTQSFSEEEIKVLMGKSHPALTEPTKMVWETKYEAGKIVTFYHDEHNKLFKINCSNCHSRENCSKCHNTKTPKDFDRPIQITKSLEEHHKPCNTCHEGNSCQKCHSGKEMSPFNHAKSSGWSLSPYHSRLNCEKCHGNSVPFKKLNRNCTTCHKNFTKGSFEHAKVGLILSEVHKDLECNNCHKNDNYAQSPDCKECHDDKTYPKDLVRR